MLTRMQMTMQELRRRERALLIALLADPAEQTRASWAKRIKSYNDVPEIYREAFVHFASAETFPYTVITPSYAGFVQPTTEKLICAADQELYILEEDGVTCQTQSYPYEGIYHVEVQSVLLDSHITLRGMTKSGTAAISTFRFNAASDVLMAPILEKIRRVASGLDEVLAAPAPSSPKPDLFNVWMDTNYKFMNYAKRSLLEGETVVCAILHPEIREKVMTIFGKSFYRTIAPTQAAIRTNRELIIIREGRKPEENIKYGGTWDFVPLNKIVSLSLDDKEDDLVALSVHLPDNVHLSYLFEASAKPQLRPLLT